MKNKAVYGNLYQEPFCYLTPSLRNMSIAVTALVVPQVILLGAESGIRAVCAVLASVAASVAAELICSAVRRYGYIPRSIPAAVYIGLLTGMLFPSSYPPVFVFLLTFFCLFLFKYSFGYGSSAWANPAAVTVAVAYIVGSEYFPSFLTTIEQLQLRNPSLQLIQNGDIPVAGWDPAVTGFLNGAVFKFSGTAVPEGYVSLLWDSGSAVPAFRFNMLTIMASVILFACGALEWAAPLSCLLTYICSVRIFGSYAVGGAAGQGDMLLALCTGGTLFSVLFLLQWPGTTPSSRAGKIVYGIAAGALLFLISGCGTSPVGAVFAILTANVFSVVIVYIENRIFSKRVGQHVQPRFDGLRGYAD